jgi:hypothetical protein
MKGDFSYLPRTSEPHYSGVLHQQGRVLLDRDWNEAVSIAARWRAAVGRDSFGAGVLAVPASGIGAFKVQAASSDGSQVSVTLDAGRAWADGLSLCLDGAATLTASYFGAPFQSPPASPATIDAGVRDLVVLDVWEDSVSGFQDPLNLIEPALGGPDTTARVQAFVNLKLLRLGPNDDCSAALALADDFGAKGTLTVSPAPILSVSGDCPLEAGGGYTGLEHYLYRIEVADPDKAGKPRFKWSQWNGGLAGRGLYAAGAPGKASVAITANDQMINHCGVGAFYLEALGFDAALGHWRIVLTADATLAQDGVLGLTNVQGAWPAPTPATGFFRLWNGIALVADYPAAALNPVELKDGIRLEFDAPLPGNANYQPGDFWSFPVRASGAAFAAPIWPGKAAPHGIHHSRVALGILRWQGKPPAAISADAGEIDDCRRIFRALSNQKVCCTFNVGDGRTSHGDFDSIEQALQHLPASGGEICLLPGLHETNAVLTGLRNVRIKGCDTKTKLMPRQKTANAPIFSVIDCVNVSLEHMDMVALSGAAIVVDAAKPDGVADVGIAHNRILAFTHAIAANNLKGANFHHNRIRMLDKNGGGAAISLTGTDGLIERNEIRLVPAASMPPIAVPGDPDPVDPNDPCAELGILYVNPRWFVSYVNDLWTLFLPVLMALAQPYRALGGIALGGASERLRVLENTVVGGAGNGVTLGTMLAPPAPEPDHVFTLPQEARIDGLLLGPEGKPRAGVQVTLTDTKTNAARVFTTDANGGFLLGSNPATFRVDVGAPGFLIDKLDFAANGGDRSYVLTIVLKADDQPANTQTGFLYQIAIERNTISAMGLSGIGVAAFAPTTSPRRQNYNSLAQARGRLSTPVVGLEILGNHISACLLNLFDNALRDTAANQGLGGISLGMCAALSIVDNHIEANGVSAVDPVCGIFVAYGEEVDIAHNRVVNNGPLTPAIGARELQAGRRGGIVLNLVSNFNVLDAHAARQGVSFSLRAAARIHDNVVDQPVGHALYAAAFGPVQCSDNAFSSELSGLSEQEALAGTVFLFDLGGAYQAPAGVSLHRANDIQLVDHGNTGLDPANQPAAQAGAAASPQSYHAAPAAMLPIRDAAVTTLLPAGNVMFNDNQMRAGQSHTSTTCQLVATLDDLAFQDNQCFSLRSGNLFANGLLFGDTLRASGNRFSERGGTTLLSLFSLAGRLNNTSFNQGDHCIIAVDQNPAMAEVRVGNQVLNPGAQCARLNGIAALLFKPHG